MITKQTIRENLVIEGIENNDMIGVNHKKHMEKIDSNFPSIVSSKKIDPPYKLEPLNKDMFTKFLRKPNSWYIVIYWSSGMPRRYALTKENENTLLIFKKESEAEKLAKTLKEGTHDFQKREGEWSALKGMEYKVVKIEL